MRNAPFVHQSTEGCNRQQQLGRGCCWTGQQLALPCHRVLSALPTGCPVVPAHERWSADLWYGLVAQVLLRPSEAHGTAGLRVATGWGL